MRKLPLLLSVPHAGLQVPPEVTSRCRLTAKEIAADGDVGARQIYRLEPEVEAFVTTEIARAIVDQNRAEDDRTKDGLVKTHTCWEVPVYREPLPEEIVRDLIERYHRPYHGRLSALAGADVILGIDCHTMATFGPPVGPDPGQERPAVCLSNADETCPTAWIESLAECFAESFGRETRINDPFRGGYIIRAHAPELPWIQLELSRAPFASFKQKRERVLRALHQWCRLHRSGPSGRSRSTGPDLQ